MYGRRNPKCRILNEKKGRNYLFLIIFLLNVIIYNTFVPLEDFFIQILNIQL